MRGSFSVSLASYTETEVADLLKKTEVAVMMMNQPVRIMLLLPGSFWVGMGVFSSRNFLGSATVALLFLFGN